MARYTPQRLTNGVVVPGGLDLRPRGQPLPLESTKGPYRAVVMQTYVSTDAQSYRRKSVECDVVLTKIHRRLPRVPVLQRNHGVNSADLWVPRATERTVSLAPLEETSTLYDDYDGDFVLVDFIEGVAEHPVIIGALSHEQTKRKIILGTGWSEADLGASRGTAHTLERYVHHRGTEFRINQMGDVLIDTVGSYGADDTETTPAGAGQVRVRLKDLQKFTIECDGVDVLEVYKDLDGVHIDAGEGATEKMVLGDKLLAKMSAIQVGTAFGLSSTPVNAAEFTEFLSTQHRVK